MQALDAGRCPSGKYDPTGPSEDPAAVTVLILVQS